MAKGCVCRVWAYEVGSIPQLAPRYSQTSKLSNYIPRPRDTRPPSPPRDFGKREKNNFFCKESGSVRELNYPNENKFAPTRPQATCEENITLNIPPPPPPKAQRSRKRKRERRGRKKSLIRVKTLARTSPLPSTRMDLPSLYLRHNLPPRAWTSPPYT